MTVIPPSDIQDGGTQMRVEMKPDVVRDYADDMATGATFPPVVVYYDGTDYWLGDGFHRVEAARKLGHESIKAEVLDGDVRQAILHGIGSNASQDEEGEPVLKPGDRSYENTSNDWALLNRASLSARYLDLIPLDALVDRRNDEPMIFTSAEPVTVPHIMIQDQWPDAVDYLSDTPDLPYYQTEGFEPEKDYLVEVWIEKSTQNDWLVPLCKRRGVNLVARREVIRG